jgi:hypothetical protein
MSLGIAMKIPRLEIEINVSFEFGIEAHQAAEIGTDLAINSCGFASRYGRTFKRGRQTIPKKWNRSFPEDLYALSQWAAGPRLTFKASEHARRWQIAGSDFPAKCNDLTFPECQPLLTTTACFREEAFSASGDILRIARTSGRDAFSWPKWTVGSGGRPQKVAD